MEIIAQRKELAKWASKMNDAYTHSSHLIHCKAVAIYLFAILWLQSSACESVNSIVFAAEKKILARILQFSNSSKFRLKTI